MIKQDEIYLKHIIEIISEFSFDTDYGENLNFDEFYFL